MKHLGRSKDISSYEYIVPFRMISESLKRLIARDVTRTRETPVGPGPSLLRSNYRLESPRADPGLRIDSEESLMGPTKRTKRLEWYLQNSVEYPKPLGHEKTSPQRHGLSSSNLTGDAKEKRTSLLATLVHRQGTTWSWPSDYRDRRLVFPKV